MDVEEQVFNAIDLSADAILEIEEMKEGRRRDAPAVSALFNFLRVPAPSFSLNGNNAVSMLADVRSYGLLRNSLARANPGAVSASFADLKPFIEKYLTQLEEGITNNNRQKIEEARALCLALHENFMSEQLSEIYQRRERSDSRYLINDNVQ